MPGASGKREPEEQVSALGKLGTSSGVRVHGSRVVAKQARSSEAAVVLVPDAQGLVGDPDKSTWPSLSGSPTEVGVE